MSFQDFNFHPSIMAGVQTLGYDKPTPIQLQSIPHIMHGRDVIGLAQTGTGKTAAFTLPILQRLLKGQRKSIRAAIISPTRELAGQTCEVINTLGKRTGLQSLAIYGGVSMDQQIRELSSGIDIAVACPGRLIDHLWRGTIGFSNLEVLVIDEADRMFDMGFLPDIRNILRCALSPRQTLLFSATMPSSIRGLVKDVLRDPVTVQIGRTAPATTVSHTLYPVQQQRKTALLTELLQRTETESVLIFTRTKHRAARVAQQLQKTGFAAASLHGNLSQGQRQSVLERFRTRSSKILVATDIAARGIDVLHISHVINYDMPESIDAYTHRIGRTGRVNKKGSALTFATATDTAMVGVLERTLNKLLTRRMIQGFDDAAPGPGTKSGRPARRPRRYA